MAFLVMSGVRKGYGPAGRRVSVLRDIDLELEKGEFVAIVGYSGSGKTTLLSILGAILTPSGGRVVVNGHEIVASRANDLAAIRRQAIGFVFQQFNLFPALSAVENVEYALNIKGMNGGGARREAEAALDAVGLAERKHFLPRDLSGGQKQRVAVARALAGRPPILLADEPTANLDSQVGLQILEMFRDLAKRDARALLIVTHDPKVRGIADRVLRIRDGLLLNGSE